MLFDAATPVMCRPLSAPGWAIVPGRPAAVAGKERFNGHGVLLPDGKVLFVGGIADPSQDDAKGVKETEIYDPASGAWVLGSPMQNSRNYHSAAILLYDGRVLLGGSNKYGGQGYYTGPYPLTDYTNYVNQFTLANLELNRDLSLEIYTPDYLWRGPRPVFSHAKDVVGYGDLLNIRLAKGWKFQNLRSDRIALVRCYSSTHAFGFDQRYVAINSFKLGDLSNAPAATDVEFSLEIPINPAILPPGFYMLFLFSKLEENWLGAPSLGHIIQIC